MAGDSPLQPITYIELTHTFDDWRVLTNQVLARVNNAASQNTAGSDYDQLSGSIVIRDTTGSFASNTITAELFHGRPGQIHRRPLCHRFAPPVQHRHRPQSDYQ